MVIIYGIRNCDTMKKARSWLDSHQVPHEFHDYKLAAIERSTVTGWVKQVGWQLLLNRAGTTFRRLPEADKEDLTESKAISLMVANPSLIKRPVLAVDGRLAVGFKPEEYQALLLVKGG
jgi:arsenate reductase